MDDDESTQKFNKKFISSCCSFIGCIFVAFCLMLGIILLLAIYGSIALFNKLQNKE